MKMEITLAIKISTYICLVDMVIYLSIDFVHTFLFHFLYGETMVHIICI